MPHFKVRTLREREIAAAFPLVRIAAPGIVPHDWETFAGGLDERGGALLGLFGGDSTLLGIAVYRVEPTLRGTRLVIDAIVTFELGRAATARTALLAALEEEAIRQGCAGMSLTLPAKGNVEASAKAKAWLRDGFVFETVSISRPLAANRADEVA